MDKNQFLEVIKDKIRSGEVSRDELLNYINSVSEDGVETLHVGTKNPVSHYVTKMLYALGAIVVIVGIVIFISQIWNDLVPALRIIITLGLGLLTTAMGSILLSAKPEENIGKVFQFIGGVLIPGGVLVTLSEYNINFDTLWPIANTFFCVLIFYMLLNFVYRNIVLTLFTTIYGTAFVYLVIGAMVNEQGFSSQDVYVYVTMILGVSYILIANAFSSNWNKKLSSALYFFGIFGLLGAAFFHVLEANTWQLFYFLIVAGCLWSAVYLKSRTVLAVSTLFLIAHISYITNKYFADSLGWPISLMILGFIFIGLGFISIRINKKYISN